MLYYYGARYYNPRESVWLSVDPLWENSGAERSPYEYTYSNPVNLIDPTGEIPYPITIRAFAPFKTFGFGFHGDNRGYSTSQAVSSRVTNWIAFDTDKTSISTGGYSSPTWHKMNSNYVKKANPEAKFRGDFTTSTNGNSKTFNFGTHVKGSNPLTPGAPNIDVFSDFSITENKKGGTLDIRGSLTGDNFPSTEAFISDPKGQSVFLGVGQIDKGTDPDFGPGKLFGQGEDNSITKFKLSITTDKRGNFTGVKSGGKNFTVQEWNKQFESVKPVKE